ncbi:MAG: Na/Pi cotransporter family protein [Firmicutes bacterium]|nr:Na/Pi cotransporter family protein [Bacillota bacterium]
MNVLTYLPLAAGIGLFLYGMHILGQSLERLAGNKMEQTLEKLTDNPLKGALLGTGVTAVIQSSAATVIMVIGLLNANIFTLFQAFPVIMGANLGTTVTGQLLRLGDISGAGTVLSLLKPSAFGPVLVAVGACMIVFCKKHSVRTKGNLIIGLGMLFFGMYTMESTLAPLGQQQWFLDLLVAVQNPLIGVILGFIMTAVLQSSSASVGILQALSITGAITYSNAIPLILGQNIGSCMTVLLATAGSTRKAKRAAFLHVFYKTLGVIVFLAVIYGADAFFHFGFWDTVLNRGSVADFHTLFNIIILIGFFPFRNLIVRMTEKLIPDKAVAGPSSEAETQLARLDSFLLATPALALAESRKVVIDMGETALASFDLARKLHENYTEEGEEELQRYEDFLDRAENKLNNYILQITPHRLSNRENNTAAEMLHSIGNFERIGDHCINILDVARFNAENSITYSDSAWVELNKILDASREILSETVALYRNNDAQAASHIEPYEQVIDEMQQILKDRHIDRLRLGLCNVDSGISFLEILGNLERISDHCSNIALNILQMNSKDYIHFAYHEKVNEGPKLSDSPEFTIHEDYFRAKYALPVDNPEVEKKLEEEREAAIEELKQEEWRQEEELKKKYGKAKEKDKAKDKDKAKSKEKVKEDKKKKK